MSKMQSSWCTLHGLQFLLLLFKTAFERLASPWTTKHLRKVRFVSLLLKKKKHLEWHICRNLSNTVHKFYCLRCWTLFMPSKVCTGQFQHKLYYSISQSFPHRMMQEITFDIGRRIDHYCECWALSGLSGKTAQTEEDDIHSLWVMLIRLAKVPYNVSLSS